MPDRGRERGRHRGDRLILEPLNPDTLQSHELRSFRHNCARLARFLVDSDDIEDGFLENVEENNDHGLISHHNQLDG
jgi:hypothetical protein